MFWLHKNVNSMLAVFILLPFINCWVTSINYSFVTAVMAKFFRISSTWIFILMLNGYYASFKTSQVSS